MVAEWSTVSLRDANVALIDCDHRTPPAAESGFPYVAIPQLRDGRIDLSDARRISPGDFVQWTRKANPKADDVVLSRRCNPGETAFVASDMRFALGQNLVLLRADGTKIYPPFLRWLARGPDWWEQIARFINVGAVFDSLKCADIPSFRLRIPPLPEQRAIAHVLGSLDDKIELNHRMSETIEAIARAIFNDWFVEFGPSRAKMELQPRYLTPELWHFFPAQLDGDGKPEGWRESPLASFFSIIGGGTPKTEIPKYWNGEIPWFSVRDTPRKGSVFVYETEKSITRLGLDASSACLVPAGTTIISARGTVGNLAIAAQEMAFNQSCYALRGSGAPGDCFVFLAAQHMVTRLRMMAHGSVFPTITRDTFEAVSLARPPEGLLLGFEGVVNPMFAKIKANGYESRTLAALRDLLLPKLLSGEIRLRDAERAVADVA